jgi:long-chain acyl-CoA synthetase
LRYLLRGRVPISGTLTFHELNRHVDQFGAELAHLGVRKGDRVALMLPNSPQFLVAFFGALRAGAVVVAINPTYTAHELGYHLRDSEAETLVILDMFAPLLAALPAPTPLKRTIVTTIADMLPPAARLLVQTMQRQRDAVQADQAAHFAFADLLRQRDLSPPTCVIGPDDLALLQYTGGTTGIPRAAMLRHRNIMANLWQHIAWMSDVHPGNDRIMAAIPFFHVYGMSVCMLFGIAMGCEQVLVPNPRLLPHVMQTIERERCAIFPGVPALYMGIVNHPAVRDYDLRTIRICVSGSAPLPVAVQEKFEALTGGRLVEGYGLSEAAPVTHCTPMRGARRAGSIGLPYPDVEARLIDLETGADLPFDGEQAGELLVRGPQVMQGYWRRPEETATALDADGWLATGDICRADPDGFFYVIDRRKDVLLVSGYTVLPREIEDVLLQHPGVREVVIAGVPHPERGDDTVTAYLVAATDLPPTLEELRQFARAYLAPYKLPRVLEVRDALPRNAVGKVLRRQLVQGN